MQLFKKTMGSYGVNIGIVLGQTFTIGTPLLEVMLMLTVTFDLCGGPEGKTITDSLTWP